MVVVALPEMDRAHLVVRGVRALSPQVPILAMDPEGEKRQIDRLNRIRRERDGREAARSLKTPESACRDGENVMPRLLDAVNAYCTLGEMCDVMRDVFGIYQEDAVV